MNDLAEIDRIDGVWGNPEAQLTSGSQWFSHPLVKERINLRASGDPRCDAYGALLALLKRHGIALPAAAVGSLGCGTGELERGLVQYDFGQCYEGYDIAPTAIAAAERLAREAGLDAKLRYTCVNLEQFPLPTARYGIVFGHQAVHHVSSLEHLFANVWNALTPGGIMHLHEFVGPRRFQWSGAQLRGAQDWLDQLPERYRVRGDGLIRTTIQRPSVEDVVRHDPSESIRSDDIIPVMSQWFDTMDHRPLGGALCHIALEHIAQNFAIDDPVANAFIVDLFEREDAMMQAGIILSDFAVITAVRRADPKPR